LPNNINHAPEMVFFARSAHQQCICRCLER